VPLYLNGCGGSDNAARGGHLKNISLKQKKKGTQENEKGFGFTAGPGYDAMHDGLRRQQR